MQNEEMILADEFCVHHNIELSFIYSLKDSGLIETIILDEKIFVSLSQLQHLEKLVRLYHDLDINLEGIETIIHLLEKLSVMEQRIHELTNRLDLYENQ